MNRKEKQIFSSLLSLNEKMNFSENIEFDQTISMLKRSNFDALREFVCEKEKFC